MIALRAPAYALPRTIDMPVVVHGKDPSEMALDCVWGIVTHMLNGVVSTRLSPEESIVL